MMVYSIENEVFDFNLCATTPCIKRIFLEGGGWGEGRGQGTAEHSSEKVFY